MDGGGPVHRQVGDHPAIHQLDEEWRETGLHDVTAEHHHDSSTLYCGSCDRVHNLQEIPRDEDIWQ